MRLSLGVSGVIVGALSCVCCAAPPPLPGSLAPKSPPPAVTASAARTDSTTRATPAPIDPDADPERLALVRSICPAAIDHREGRVRVGCRACPPFDGKGAKPDGKVEVDPESFWPVEALYHGSFSRPGASEVAAVFQGCEPHVGAYGGTLFAERTTAGWRAMTYESGMHPDSCEIYHRQDGRDLLVCKRSDTWQLTSITNVFVYDLARAANGMSSLAQVSDNSLSVCSSGVSQSSGVVQGRVLGIRLEDRNHDGLPDVVIDVLHRTTPYSPKIDKTIRAACANAEPHTDDPNELRVIDVAALLGKPAKESLELIFDGQDFQPTARTAASRERLAPFL